VPLLSYLFLVFVFFHTPNLKHSFNLFWRQVLGLEGQVLTACLTFQLPRITTDSCQSHRRQPTTGSFQSLQCLKECNKPLVRWKIFAIHKLVSWFFHVGWASGLQTVFWWDNVTNQNYVWIILLKMTFYFPRYSGYIWQARWTIWRFSCQIF